jgi:hypothetical protein
MAKEMICAKCGMQTKPKLYTRGSILIEIILWMCFFVPVPGLIYSIWRRMFSYKGCPKCNETNMIPLDSPIAQQMLQNFSVGKIVAKNDKEANEMVYEGSII